MTHIVHDLEEKIMECWNVVDDIDVVWTEHSDSKEPMSDDELANILLGMQALYNRKFQRLQASFERVCEHGGVWLTKEEVRLTKEYQAGGDETEHW